VKLHETGSEKLRMQVRNYMRRLREQARQENEHQGKESSFHNVVFTDRRIGHLNGHCVDRLVLFLRGTGCSWVSQVGGCTFCGFWDATNFGHKVSDSQYLQQVDNALENVAAEIERFPIVCLYNDGSLLVETEMGFEVLCAILKRLAGYQHVRRLVIEAKIVDIKEAQLPKLMSAVGPKELEIAVGFESANPTVRDLCVNKNFSDDVFAARAALLRDHGIRLVPLVMIKPPFLTEGQAIHDAVETLERLDQFSFPRIDLEMATVERHTLVAELWRQGLYSPPRLWSVIEIIKRSRALGVRTPTFISPPNYSVPSLDFTSNCPACTPLAVEAIQHYNQAFDVSSFEPLNCACRDEWAACLEEVSASPDLEAQVQRIFSRLIEQGQAAVAHQVVQ
jgi:radical SAM enzyme (TIGR01210 family)